VRLETVKPPTTHRLAIQRCAVGRYAASQAHPTALLPPTTHRLAIQRCAVGRYAASQAHPTVLPVLRRPVAASARRPASRHPERRPPQGCHRPRIWPAV